MSVHYSAAINCSFTKHAFTTVKNREKAFFVVLHAHGFAKKTTFLYNLYIDLCSFLLMFGGKLPLTLKISLFWIRHGNKALFYSVYYISL